MDKKEIIKAIQASAYIHRSCSNINQADQLDEVVKELLKPPEAEKIEKLKCYNHIVKRWQTGITLKELTETKNIQWVNLTFYVDKQQTTKEG